MPDPPVEVTELLLRWSGGETAAFAEAIPAVYAELRKIARRYMRKERPDHTLQTSALVNEAYLRLVDQRAIEWQDRRHFYAVAARIMRHVLVDHARGQQCEKRAAGVRAFPLDAAEAIGAERAPEFVALDEALDELAALDPRKANIVELRFFGGLTVEEAAEQVGLSPATIMREWRAARAWLHQRLTGESAGVER